ncbi:MAG: ABC transporter permease [Chitinispirillaceae bacterium]|nr:ABC transporter permease [Chitinispirillaceae bacterium]
MKLLLNLLKTPMFVIGTTIFFGTVLVALFAPMMYHVDIIARVGMPYMPPGKEHLLGTNHLGVDMMSLLIKGLGSSLYVGFLAGMIATVTGTLLGIYGGFKGGWQDDFITLITNLFLVIPTFVVLILISSSLKEGRSLALIAGIIGATAWTWSARAVRAQSASIKSRDHIALARVNGEGTLKIVVKQILPYLFSYVFMVFIMQTASGILSEACISMIGLGPYDTVSLGTILNEAMRNEALGDGAWWAFIPPMILITIIVFALNFINTSMEGVFNPRLRK